MTLQHQHPEKPWVATEPIAEAITTEVALHELLLGIARGMEPPRLYPRAVVEFVDTVLEAFVKGELDNLRDDDARESPLIRLLHPAAGYAKGAAYPILVGFAARVYDSGCDLILANRMLIDLLGLGRSSEVRYFEQRQDGPMTQLLASTSAFKATFGWDVRVSARCLVSWIT